MAAATQAFTEWLEKEGSISNVEIGPKGQHGYFAVASRDLEANEALFTVPLHLTIHEYTPAYLEWRDNVLLPAIHSNVGKAKEILERESGSSNNASDGDEGGAANASSSTAPGTFPLYLFLMHHRAIKERSFWSPYITMLPQEPVRSPICYGDELLKELEGTSAHTTAIKISSALKKSHLRVVTRCIERDPTNFPEQSFNYERLLWAYTMFSSRGFALHVPHAIGPIQERLCEADGVQIQVTTSIDSRHNTTASVAQMNGKDVTTTVEAHACLAVPALVPLADILNHHHKAKVTFNTSLTDIRECHVTANSPDGNNNSDNNNNSSVPNHTVRTLRGCFSLVTETPFEAGNEVYNNYGPTKDNGQLLVSYGFVESDNTQDKYDITLGKLKEPSEEDLEDEDADAVAVIRMRHALSVQLGLHDKHTLSLACRVPDDLVLRVSLQLLDRDDVRVIQSALRNDVSPSSIRKLTREDVRLLLGESKYRLSLLAVEEMLRAGYRLKAETWIEEDAAALEDLEGEGPSDMRNCLIYRLGQKRVVDSSLERLKELLHNLGHGARLKRDENKSTWPQSIIPAVPVASNALQHHRVPAGLVVSNAYLDYASSLSSLFGAVQGLAYPQKLVLWLVFEKNKFDEKLATENVGASSAKRQKKEKDDAQDAIEQSLWALFRSLDDLSNSTGRVFSTTPYFSPQAQATVAGTPLEAQTAEYMMQLRGEFEDVVSPLSEAMPLISESSGFSWPNYLWAATLSDMLSVRVRRGEDASKRPYGAPSCFLDDPSATVADCFIAHLPPPFSPNKLKIAAEKSGQVEFLPHGDPDEQTALEPSLPPHSVDSLQNVELALKYGVADPYTTGECVHLTLPDEAAQLNGGVGVGRQFFLRACRPSVKSLLELFGGDKESLSAYLSDRVTRVRGRLDTSTPREARERTQKVADDYIASYANALEQSLEILKSDETMEES